MSKKRRNRNTGNQNRSAQKVTGTDVVETSSLHDVLEDGDSSETKPQEKENSAPVEEDSAKDQSTGGLEILYENGDASDDKGNDKPEAPEEDVSDDTLEIAWESVDQDSKKEPDKVPEEAEKPESEEESGLTEEYNAPEALKEESQIEESQMEGPAAEPEPNTEETAEESDSGTIEPESDQEASPKEEPAADTEGKEEQEEPEEETPSESSNNTEASESEAPSDETSSIPAVSNPSHEAASSRRTKKPRRRRQQSESKESKTQSGQKKSSATGIVLTDAETEEEKAEREAEAKGWMSPEEAARGEEGQGRKKRTKVGNWWHHLKRGIRIAVIVIVCLFLAAIGFFHYEYSRLQKDQSDAYTDEYVAQLKQEEDNSSVAKSAEEDMEKNLEGVEESEVVEAEGEIFQDSNVYNILLIGTDDRTEKFSTDARGDTCILLSINKETGKVTLASFERGIGVPILWGPYEGQWDWLTHMFRYGGAQMMVEEIRDNFLVDVNRYIRVNIRTLVKLIDAIGGIDVELTQAEADHLNNPEGTFTEGYAKGIGMEDEEQFDLVAGVNHLNGVTAMVYARTRYIDDDWHRVQRQRKVIMAAAEKLSQLSASEMIATLDAVVPLVQTDLSETEVAELLTLAPTFMGAEIQQITIPADGTYGSMKGMDGRSMYAVDFNANAKILKELLYGVTDEEAAEEVEEAGGTAATDYTNTSRSEGYVSEEDVTADEATQAQAEQAEADAEAANSGTTTASGTTSGSDTSGSTYSYSYSYSQSTTNSEVEQAMDVTQDSTETVTQDTTGTTTDTTGTTTDSTAATDTTDYATLQSAYQQQADTLNEQATQLQAAATQAALQAQDTTLSEEERAAAQEQANELAVQAQQQAVAAQQAQQQADAAAEALAAQTGTENGTGMGY